MTKPGAGRSAECADTADATMEERILAEAPIERSIRFWMRAYPRRWREAQGGELLGLVVDLAEPGALRLGGRAALDLVRGGWATRVREHPPMHTWLLYRMFDRRVPVAYRSWALDDINGFWYPVRCSLLFFALVFAMPLFAADSQGYGGPSASYYLMGALVAFSMLFLWPEGSRSRARIKHVATPFGEPVVEGTLVAGDVPRQRVTARSMLSWAVLLLGITGAASVVAALLAPKVLLLSRMPDHAVSLDVAPVGGRRIAAVTILVVALGLGVLGAFVARRRLRQCLGELPAQPDRVMRPIRATGKVNVLFWTMVIVVLTWLEVSGTLVLGLSVVLGLGALGFLPAAAAALAVTRLTDAPDLAGRDVWWIATRGRLPHVDRPDYGLRRLPNPVPNAVN